MADEVSDRGEELHVSERIHCTVNVCLFILFVFLHSCQSVFVLSVDSLF